MNPRSLNLVYFSPTGNCRRAAHAIARGINLTPCHEFDRTTPRSRTSGQHFMGRDLVMIVLPVYGGRLPRIMDGILAGITTEKSPAIFVVLYGNRGYDDALLELKNIATKKGFIGIAAAAFSSEHALSSKVGTGRPDHTDLAIMEEFGKNIMVKAKAIGLPEFAPSFKINGTFPYRREPLNMQTWPTSKTEVCRQCHTCVNVCPMGAINANNPQMVDRTKCISCCHCVNSCPNQARYIEDARFLADVRKMEEANLPYREAEIFI